MHLAPSTIKPGSTGCKIKNQKCIWDKIKNIWEQNQKYLGTKKYILEPSIILSNRGHKVNCTMYTLYNTIHHNTDIHFTIRQIHLGALYCKLYWKSFQPKIIQERGCWINRSIILPYSSGPFLPCSWWWYLYLLLLTSAGSVYSKRDQQWHHKAK